MKTFTQTTSYTTRLRRIIIVISLFFVIGFIASYFSNKSFLDGLKEMDNANQVLNHSSQVTDSLNTSIQYSQNFFSHKNISDTQYAFRKSNDLARSELLEAISHADDFVVPKTHLSAALVAIENYQDVVDELIKTNLRKNAKINNNETLKSELVVAEQYVLEAKENIRKAQIFMKQESDKSFEEIYQHRFTPLYVAISLTILFFTTVILLGFSFVRKLSSAVNNLNKATEAVAKGDFTYKANILEKDEIGKLTYEFNFMVSRLHYTMKHVKRLQDITEAFSEALTSTEVFDTIIRQGMDALEASAGSVAMMNDLGTALIMKKMSGHTEEIKATFQTIPLDLDVPMIKVVKTKIPLFIEDDAEIRSQFKDMPQSYFGLIKAIAVLPLIANGEVFGALSFNFKFERKFSQEEKEFVFALARQCSQAIHRVKLFEDAQQAIKARDEFLSIASHELKTPLTPLKLQLQVLARRVHQGNTEQLTSDKLLQMVDKSNLQITRLTTLIEDLLDVSRITTGKLTLNFERFELGEMIREIVDQYRQQLRIEDTEIEIEASTATYAILDRVRIEQVLINILTNAGKYAPGKPVKIKLDVHGPFARISVKDQGPGIDKINQKRVFERFERVSDRNNIGGLGLGLYISKQIVEAHGGKIFVDSFKGEGSNFIFEIPLVPENTKLSHSVENNIQ